MSSLLKVKLGSSSYLCKWAATKVWELDIKNLAIASQTFPNGLVLTISNPNNISKVDDSTKLRSQGNFDFFLTNLNILGKLKKIELVIDAFSDGGRYAYAGALETYIRSSYDYSKYGPWNATNSDNGKPWTMYDGYLFSVENYPPHKWTGYQGIDLTFPMTYTVTIGDTIQCFYNDTKIAEKDNDLDTYPAEQNWYSLGWNSGGNNTADIVISSVKVYYV